MWKVHLEELARFGMLGFRLYVGKAKFDGSHDLLTLPTVKTVDPASLIAQEDAFLDDSNPFNPNVKAFLQAMSDAAWEIGIKPKQIEDSRNELAAVRYHLEDMRKLAIKEGK